MNDWRLVPRTRGDGNGAGQSLRRWMHSAIVPFWDSGHLNSHQRQISIKAKRQIQKQLQSMGWGHRKMDM